MQGKELSKGISFNERDLNILKVNGGIRFRGTCCKWQEEKGIKSCTVSEKMGVGGNWAGGGNWPGPGRGTGGSERGEAGWSCAASL